jgi:bifunctional oligoribonuclease and PAP phosphatase NrnA
MSSETTPMAAATAIIGSAESMAMACHVGPDGDALGSMLGLAAAAAARGVEVFPSFGEPFTVPEAFRFLPLDLLVKPASVPDQPAVMVTFDAGSADRLGTLAENASRARELVVIDHHISNTGFGSVNLIDAGSAATAEIVYRLLVEMGWEIDEVVATCLHVGLVTDTGRFQYSNTTPATLEVAARLVEAGARPEVIGQYVYEEVPFGYLGVAGSVLGRAVLEPDRRLVWSFVTAEDLKRFGIGLDDTDPLIDALRVARESDVAMLLKDMGSDRIKVSLRSRGRADVGSIAVTLGGGGHHNAAGFNFEGSVDEAAAAVRSLLAPVDEG